MKPTYSSLILLFFTFFTSLYYALACEVDAFCSTLYGPSAICISNVCVCKRSNIDVNCETGQPMSNSKNIFVSFFLRYIWRIEILYFFLAIAVITFISWAVYWAVSKKRKASGRQNNQPENGEHVPLEVKNSS